MILTQKQGDQFKEFYRNLYGDTSVETGTGKIPRLHESLQKEHVKLWKDFFKKLLGPRVSKKIYIHRGGRQEDYLHLVFNNLYMNYGPTWVDDNGKVSKERIWIDDVD